MKQNICYILVNYRGHHRKGMEIYNYAEVNFQLKVKFHLTKMYF